MPRWTTEARQQQAERIRALCPWMKSTGPRSDEGKARSARNAWKGGVRAEATHYLQILRQIAATTKMVFSSFGRKRQPAEQPRSDHGGPNTPANLFSSFCQKGMNQLRPPVPPPILGLNVADPDDAVPEADEFSSEALLAKAERLMRIRENLFGQGFV